MANEQTTQDPAAVAKRCIEDVTYAQQIIETNEYPEIRDAVLADIAENAEVQGFLNPCPLPPDKIGRSPLLSSSPVTNFRASSAFFTQPQWNTFNFTHLNGFAFGR